MEGKQTEYLDKKAYSFDKTLKVVVKSALDYGNVLQNVEVFNLLSNNSFFEDIKNLTTAVRNIILEYTKEQTEKKMTICINSGKVESDKEREKKSTVVQFCENWSSNKRVQIRL